MIGDAVSEVAAPGDALESPTGREAGTVREVAFLNVHANDGSSWRDDFREAPDISAGDFAPMSVIQGAFRRCFVPKSSILCLKTPP